MVRNKLHPIPQPPRAVPRLPARARSARSAGPSARAGDAAFRLSSSGSGFIYGVEFKEHADAGIVDPHVAFSRLEGKKRYVQDLLREQSDTVWALIEQGAIVHVCGDGGRMEPDVKRTLIAIYRDRTGADASAGDAWMAGLVADGPYVLDVWAGR